MSIYFSASAGGFYSSEIHGARRIVVADPAWARPQIEVVGEDGAITIVDDHEAQPATVEIDNPECRIPADAVEITAERHAALLAAQSEGKIIASDADGAPNSIDRPGLTTEQLWANVRRERDARLSVATAKLDRHRNQKEFGLEPSMTDARAMEWAIYAQALRDLPETQADPASIVWPSAPA